MMVFEIRCNDSSVSELCEYTERRLHIALDCSGM